MTSTLFTLRLMTNDKNRISVETNDQWQWNDNIVIFY